MRKRDEENASIELHEERLTPRTRPAEVGQIEVTTRVVEVPETVEVPVEAVAVTTERRPVNAPAGGDVAPYREGDALVIPVVEERLEVRKVAWVVEEIVVRQSRSTEVREVTDTVRREVVDIGTTGDARIDDESTRR